jgi:5-methylcytosine-specific restriction enzyme B
MESHTQVRKPEAEYPTDPKTLSRKVSEIRNFVKKIEEGEVVVAADGQTVVGRGRVTGPYRYDNGEPAPHRRPIEWISTASWTMPTPEEGKLTTVFELGRHENNLVEIERHLLDGNKSPAPKPLPRPVARENS